MNERIRYPLHQLVSSDKFYLQIRERIGDPNERCDKGYTLLYEAARSRKDNSRIFQFLLDRGAHVESTTPKEYIPLHFAVWKRNRFAVNALIKAGASINSEDLKGRTALHFAVNRKHFTSPSDMWILKQLLGHPEIRVNAVDRSGNTPLMWAVRRRNVDMVAALLKKGANPNIPNVDTCTPLLDALCQEKPNKAILTSLLTNGAGIYVHKNSGCSAVDIIVQFIRSNEAIAFDSLYYLRLIAFRYQIRESLLSKVAHSRAVSYYVNKCCQEVRLMNSVIIYGKFTLHDFTLGCFQVPDGYPIRKIYIAVVEMLLTKLFKKYSELICNSIPLADLRIIYEKTARRCLFEALLPSDSPGTTMLQEIKRFYSGNDLLRSRLKKITSEMKAIKTQLLVKRIKML